MRPEPPFKRATVFVDGQNLFHAVRDAFGYTFPNYDVAALSAALCARQDWERSGTRFYTGIPDARDDLRWHHFWAAKLGVMGREGVVVFSRRLRYRNRAVRLPDGSGTNRCASVLAERLLDVVEAADRRREMVTVW